MAIGQVYSGYPALDQTLDYIRLGDSLVWQVSLIEEFRLFARPFARQAVSEGRSVVYVRFAQHNPVLTDLTGIEMIEFDPEEGFEAFTVKIHEEINRRGRGTFYIFDCLSELQSAWYTDMMMGNFFQVTCPLLAELGTVSYFPLIRGRHSFEAVARIRDTTEVMLNLYTGGRTGRYVYVLPTKVWNRYSEQMFLPHCVDRESGEFFAVRDGVSMSRYYAALDEVAASSHQDQNYDSYDRFFSEIRMEYSHTGQFSAANEEQLIRSMMTRDRHLKELVRKYFRPNDYFALRDRMIGSGSVGGKACGMLLARRIAEEELPDEMLDHFEPHDSYYVGSDVYYTYIVHNNWWGLRIRQRAPEEYFSAAQELKERLLTGSFPVKVRERFLGMLEYFGETPIIVRSSSLLEDGFNNAFAGKYESVFCPNQGSPKERLEAFEQALRQVYASAMNVDALEYRRIRGLETKDEQMAVLVQRVSGTPFDRYFMPAAAGVGYSHSAYQWYRNMDPEAGMLRIVIGLGTRAVDRTKEDYPRLANLDRPAATLYTTPAQKHRFSQHWVDVLDRQDNCFKGMPVERLIPVLPRWYLNQVMEHDREAEDRLRQRGRSRDVWFVSCQRLLEKTEFTTMMRTLLKTLEKAYENPVDIEYAVNLDERGDFVVNLLQCRPLYLGRQGEPVDPESLKLKTVLFDISDSSMGPSGKREIDAVILVDPQKYYNYPHARKYDVAAAVGKLNRSFREQGKKILLLTPGRIGTSSPELGVPVTFAEITGCSAVCEVAETRAGYQPELSYGSHMFQDLVEAEILYGAIWNNSKTRTYNPDILSRFPDLFMEMCPDYPSLEGIVTAVETPGLGLWQDTVSSRAVCGWEKDLEEKPAEPVAASAESGDPAEPEEQDPEPIEDPDADPAPDPAPVMETPGQPPLSETPDGYTNMALFE